MTDFFCGVLSEDFLPHGHCYFWKPEIVWLYLLSDAMIAFAYYSIPVILFILVRKRRDLPFHWMFVMFGAFILGCGTTHVMEIRTLWHSTYRLSGLIKLGTAIVSVGTAAALVPIVRLGFWICCRIVEAHGGTIWLASVPGEGTTFEVVLPRHPPGAGEPAETA